MEKRLLSALVLTLLSGAALALPAHKDFQALTVGKDNHPTQEKYQHPEITQQDYGQADINKDGMAGLDAYQTSSTVRGGPSQGTNPSGAAIILAYEGGGAAGSADTSGSAEISGSGGAASTSGTAGASAGGTADSASPGSAGLGAGSASSTAAADIPAFDSLDTNKDGNLSRSEYETASTDLRVRGASSPDLTGDKDRPGMLDDKVMKSTDPSVLQGPQDAGGSGGNADKQPSGGSTGDIAR